MLISSYISSVNQLNAARYGYQDFVINNTQGLPLNELTEKDIFAEYGTTKTLGYVLPNGKSFDNGFSIALYDENAVRITNKQLIEGELPQNEGEIAIESFMLGRLRLDTNIGDNITLTIAVPDGTDFMEKTIEKTYTLTGILQNQMP